MANKTQARWTKILIYIGCGIFIVNFLAAWFLTYRSNQYIATSFLGSDDPYGRLQESVDKINDASDNSILFLSRVMEAEVSLKSISNKQTATIVAMAGGFGLLAIGFALFVMGIEQAFQAEAEFLDKGKFILNSSAPGLLCFALATIIFIVAVTRTSKIKFKRFDLEPPPISEMERKIADEEIHSSPP